MRAATTGRRRAKVLVSLLAGLLVGGFAGGGLAWYFNRSKIGPLVEGGEPALATADELALVPADAVAVVHVRVREAWHTEPMARYRELLAKAGPEALKVLEEEFTPSLTTLDRVTLVVAKVDDKKADAIWGEERAKTQKQFDAEMQAMRAGRPMPPRQPEPKAHPLQLPRELAEAHSWYLVLTFTDPFNAKGVIDANFKNAAERDAGGKTYWYHTDSRLAICFPTARWVVVGSEPGVKALLTRKPVADGPLAPAVSLARGGSRHLVAGLNLTADPLGPGLSEARKKLAELAANPPRPNPRKGNDPPEWAVKMAPDLVAISTAEAVTFSAGVVGKGLSVDVRAHYKTDGEAGAAEAALRALANKAREAIKAEARPQVEKMLRGESGQTPRPIDELPEAIGGLLATGGLNMADEWLASPPLRRDGKELALTAKMTDSPEGVAGATAAAVPVAVGLLLPAVQKVRGAAARAKSSNNLKQIGLAIHSFHDVNGRFPQDIKDATGKPILSWRVEILPYLEQAPLYNQFRLNEPWDSPNNKKLSQAMIPTFVSPNAPQVVDPAGYGVTSYKGVAGPQTIFERFPGPNRGGLQMFGITDGTSNTIMVMETGPATPWAKPDDYTVDVTRPLTVKPTTPGLSNGQLLVLMGDGSVRVVNTNAVPEMNIRAAFTRNGGETLWLDP